ncbi:MAG: hypothetical protein Q9165_001455 [Trypethelium subeluteriae]
MQPDSRPISHERLAAEVKGIYAGLVMVEGKCISVDGMQTTPERRSTSDHWKALVALHRTLLYEHHDFLLASQDPTKNALRRLAAKYSMPGRYWKHGIHSFLELVRRLPKSSEHYVPFVLLAYQMMALIYETVPVPTVSFPEQTWIEHLRDLVRYYRDVEDTDYRDRETWESISRFRYRKAIDQEPGPGKLSHRVAILAGRRAFQRLFYYVKALVCEQPLPSARDSVITLFNPLLEYNHPSFTRSHRREANFIRLHALIFQASFSGSFEYPLTDFSSQLGDHVEQVITEWNESAAAALLPLLGSSEVVDSSTEASVDFLRRGRSSHRPLPEDYLIRGTIVFGPMGRVQHASLSSLVENRFISQSKLLQGGPQATGVDALPQRDRDRPPVDEYGKVLPETFFSSQKAASGMDWTVSRASGALVSLFCLIAAAVIMIFASKFPERRKRYFLFGTVMSAFISVLFGIFPETTLLEQFS